MAVRGWIASSIIRRSSPAAIREDIYKIKTGHYTGPDHEAGRRVV